MALNGAHFVGESTHITDHNLIDNLLSSHTSSIAGNTSSIATHTGQIATINTSLGNTVSVNGSGNANVPGTFAAGVGAPQTTYLGLFQTTVGGNKPALRVNHNDTGTQDAFKVVNNSSSYALKVNQLNSTTPHDTVNIVANFPGAHTTVGINSQNTTLSTVKIVQSGVQTGGQIVAALGTDTGRTAAIFGADNSGSGASYLSIMEPGATASAYSATYDATGGYSSRSISILGNHTGGQLIYVSNSGIQTAGALLQLAHLSASSSAPMLQLSGGGSTADQIAGLNFRVNSAGNVAANQLFNYSGFANSRIQTATTGTIIDRNVADTNPALVVANTHASNTGDVAQFSMAGTTQLVVKGTTAAGAGIVGIGTAAAHVPTGMLEVAQKDTTTFGLAMTAIASGTDMINLKDSGGNQRFQITNAGNATFRANAQFTTSVQVGSASGDFGGGSAALSIKHVTDPTTNPTAGAILYVDSAGNLMCRTSAGNTRTVAAV